MCPDQPDRAGLSPRSPWRSFGAFAGIVLSGFYLLNLSFGLLEIPDYLPIIGNIDEVVASSLLFGCLSYFGINLVPFYRPSR